MSKQPILPGPAPAHGFPFLAVVFLITAIFGCSIYANLSYAVDSMARRDYSYFPPFEPNINGNWNHHLGAEYLNIASAMDAGKGFANPFNTLESGPTAWMPPVLPAILAGLLWVCDGDRDLVMGVVIFLQVFVLIGTGVLVLVLVQQTCTRLWTGVAAVIFFLGVLSEFHQWFQFTHDSWLVLLVLDLLLAGLCLCKPLHRWRTAVGWGLFGGVCALINPIVALAWGLFSMLFGWRQRNWSRLGVAVLAAGFALTPWIVRNYLVFGRFLPVKSNLAYELYQSQCLQPDGLLQSSAFAIHPYGSGGRERQEYKTLGEIAFLDRKREQFWQSVSANPADFLKRVGDRFLGATLWYVPFDRPKVIKRPWDFWVSRLTHPLPFLGMLVLVLSAFWQRLHWVQVAVIGVYLLYLLPYIGVSYYDRYAMPLLGVKVLLVICALDRLLSLRSNGRTNSALQGLSPLSARTGSNGRPVLVKA
jgi:hypothetical protein